MFRDIDDDIHYISEKTCQRVEKLFILFFTDFNMLVNDPTVIDYYINHPEYIDKQLLLKTIDILGAMHIKINSGFISLKKVITMFIENIDIKIKESLLLKEVYKSELPNEFIDPIGMIPIETPIELPETLCIMEKEVIFNHLVFSETNPYTRSLLTKSLLLQYNEGPLVKERINLFIKRLSDWKMENKL